MKKNPAVPALLGVSFLFVVFAAFLSRRCGAFLIAIAFGAVVADVPLPVLAQQPAKVFRIGVLSPAERPSTKIFDAFRMGLSELGYIDGQNITIEYRLAAGDDSRLPSMAAELVRLPVDIIVADGSATRIAHDATRTIPIVGWTGADPVAAGLAVSLAHPGGNVTGFAVLEIELSGKRLQLLKETFPSVSRIAALWNPVGIKLVRRATEGAAQTLGVHLLTI
jgi:putative ABC transport system substrate-binding protein